MFIWDVNIIQEVRLFCQLEFTQYILHYRFIFHELGVEHFGSEVFIQLGLKETSILYIAEKPLQKIDTMGVSFE